MTLALGGQDGVPWLVVSSPRPPHRYTDALLRQPSREAKHVEAGCHQSQDLDSTPRGLTRANFWNTPRPRRCSPGGKHRQTLTSTRSSCKLLSPFPSGNPGLRPSDPCKKDSWCVVLPLLCEAAVAQRLKFLGIPRPVGQPWRPAP